MKLLCTISLFAVALSGLVSGTALREPEQNEIQRLRRLAAKPATPLDVASAKEKAMSGLKNSASSLRGVQDMEESDPLGPPDYFSFYSCEEANWKGNCIIHRYYAAGGLCLNLPPDENDTISSVGPDKGYFCKFFLDFDCQAESVEMTYPGIPDLDRIYDPEYGVGWLNKRLSSYKCWRIGQT